MHLHDLHGLRDMGFRHVIGTMHHCTLHSIVVEPEFSTERLVSPTSRRLKSSPERKPFPCPEPHGWPFPP
jgi:hypothetical protein